MTVSTGIPQSPARAIDGVRTAAGDATAHGHGTALWTLYESPIGPLTLVGGPAAIKALHFTGDAKGLREDDYRPSAFARAVAQLEQYFAGERRCFELDLDLVGTPFQQRIWRQLLQIPYGTTIVYAALAQRIGRPDRVRAVAATVGRTPVPIIVPCHRVVAADGALTGYVGGLQRKQTLLDIERSVAAGGRPEPVWAFRQMALL